MSENKNVINFGTVLKKFRQESGLSQQQVADALGLQRSTYAYYETNKSRPSYECLKEISRLYNLKVDELLLSVSDSRVNSDEPKYDLGWKADEKFNRLSSFEQSVILKIRLMSYENKNKLVEFLDSMK